MCIGTNENGFRVRKYDLIDIDTREELTSIASTNEAIEYAKKHNCEVWFNATLVYPLSGVCKNET